MRTVLPMLRAANGQSARVLVCDRTSESANQISEVASQVGAELVPVGSPAELVARADEDTWGCVVVDYATLRSELLHHVGSFIKERPGYPVVVWSNELELPLAVEAMKWGAVDVLRKPLDNAALPAALQQAMRLGRERFLLWQEYRAVIGRFGQLSDNEKAVLSLVMQGRTNKEIASRLDCSLRTVEARRQRILRVMQTENAIELAVVLARHNLMDEALSSGAPAPASGPHFATA